MLNLMKKDLKVLFSQKRIWLLLLGVLIIGLISTSWHAKKSDTDGTYISIGVIDLDDSTYSKLLLTYFSESKLFKQYASVCVGTADEIKEKFDDGELTVYLEIPKDFAQNLIHIENVPMKAVINTSDKTKAVILKSMLDAYAKYIKAVEINCVALYDIMQDAGMPDELTEDINFKISYDLVFTALGKNDFFDYSEEQENTSIPLDMYYGLVVIFLFITYFAMIAGMDLLKERRQGSLYRLITAGVGMTRILAQKLLLYVGLFGIGVLGIQTYLFLKHEAMSGWMVQLLILYFAFTGLFFMALSGFFVKLPNYLLVSNVLILFTTVIGGGLIPVTYLPDTMKKLAKITPNYWFVQLAAKGMDQTTISLPILLVNLICILFLLCLTSLYFRKLEGGYREDV